MFQFDASRLTFMHRHGNRWLGMVPWPGRKPAPGEPGADPVVGEQIYRCEACDEEIRVIPPGEEG